MRCDVGAETGRGGGDAASGAPVGGGDDDTVGGGCALFGRRNGGSPRGDATGDGDGGWSMPSSTTTTSVVVVVDIAVRRAVRRAGIVYVLWCALHYSYKRCFHASVRRRYGSASACGVSLANVLASSVFGR